jgi:hypothetical protein
MWSLEDTSEPEAQLAVTAALHAPQDFVLKPQREGGGNNLYGATHCCLRCARAPSAHVALYHRFLPEERFMLTCTADIAAQCLQIMTAHARTSFSLCRQ